MGLSLSQTYEFAYRRRYRMPPNDPLFLETTFEDCVLDYWAHRHADDPKLRDQNFTDNFEQQMAEMEAEINERLAKEAASAGGVSVTQEVVPGEPAEDEWETLADDTFRAS